MRFVIPAKRIVGWVSGPLAQPHDHRSKFPRNPTTFAGRECWVTAVSTALPQRTVRGRLTQPTPTGRGSRRHGTTRQHRLRPSAERGVPGDVSGGGVNVSVYVGPIADPTTTRPRILHSLVRKPCKISSKRTSYPLQPVLTLPRHTQSLRAQLDRYHRG
jgi:hypothetical protein